MCLPVNVPCSPAVPCCGGYCDPTYDICATPCVAPDMACTTDGDCCSGTCDAAHHTCTNVCSDAYCDPTLKGADCCSGTCVKGTCAPQCVAPACDHPVCLEGGPLYDAQAVPPETPPSDCQGESAACVAAVCALDPYCCCTAWDSICIADVAREALTPGGACAGACP